MRMLTIFELLVGNIHRVNSVSRYNYYAGITAPRSRETFIISASVSQVQQSARVRVSMCMYVCMMYENVFLYVGVGTTLCVCVSIYVCVCVIRHVHVSLCCKVLAVRVSQA